MSKKKLAVATLVIAVLLTIATMVNAYSVGMSLTSSSKLKEGDTVVVKVNVSSVDAGEGIDTIVAELNYDKNVFEALDATGLTAGTGWTPSYAASTNMLTLTKTSKVTSAETVLTITFKVKSEISADSTTVTLKDIVVSGGRAQDNGTGDITVSNASVTVSKEAAAATPTASTSNPLNVSKSDSTKAKTKVPQTGENDVLVVSLSIVALVAVGTFVRYTVLKRSMK